MAFWATVAVVVLVAFPLSIGPECWLEESVPGSLNPHESPGHAMNARRAGFCSLPGRARMASAERERLAHQYGFASFAELLDISRPLPMLDSRARFCDINIGGARSRGAAA